MTALEGGTPVIAKASVDVSLLRELSLLTAKPFIYVFNCDADELADDDLKKRMQDLASPWEAIFLDAKFEAELVELDSDEEARNDARGDGHLRVRPGPARPRRLRHPRPADLPHRRSQGASCLDHSPGRDRPKAAGVIHTDFQRGFIKAEIVSYDDLLSAGTLLKAREAGRVRIEGKDYVMQDGDVVEFRHS